MYHTGLFPIYYIIVYIKQLYGTFTFSNIAVQMNHRRTETPHPRYSIYYDMIKIITYFYLSEMIHIHCMVFQPTNSLQTIPSNWVGFSWTQIKQIRHCVTCYITVYHVQLSHTMTDTQFHLHQYICRASIGLSRRV